MRDYWYYGLRLSSDLCLRGLPPWPAGAPAPGLVLRQGPVPDRLPGAPAAPVRLARDAAGCILLRFPQQFRLLLANAGEALIDIMPDVPMVEVEGYLLSYVAGLVLHQRRALPLHASCVLVEGRALVISGHSGRGKSTLAAALARAGHPLLSDDITVIRFDAAGRAFAVPGSPHPRLNADSVAANGLDAAQLGAGRLGDDKKIWYRAAHGFDAVPVAAVIRLDVAPPGAGPSLTRLGGPGALLPLQELVYRFALGRRLGAAGELAHAALRLAAAVPIHRLARAQDFATLDAAVGLLLGAVTRR